MPSSTGGGSGVCPPSGSQNLAVRSELARLLASPQLSGSKRLQQFLSFVVEATIEGNTSDLKESVIGVQVFEREPGFDPKQDPVVRVTARRLREKLEEFYAADGNNSAVQVRIAKGAYIPEFLTLPSAERPAAPEPLPPPTAPAARTRFPVKVLVISAAIAVLCSVMSLIFVRSETDTEPAMGPVSRFTIDLPPDQTLGQYFGSNLTFSPDGRRLAYVALQNGVFRLFVRDLSQSQSQVIRNSDGAAAPLYSRDGGSIVVYVPGHLRLFSLNGGYRDVAAVAPKLALFGAAWDGKRLLYDDAPPEVLTHGLSAIYQIEPGSNGNRGQVSLPGDGESLMVQQTLPESKGYLITVHGDQEWVGVLTPSGERKPLVSNARGGMYLPKGYLTFWSEGSLKVAPMSLDSLELTGPQITAVKNVGFSGWEGAEAAVSRQGTLAYVERSPHLSDRRLIWVDYAGNETPLPIPPAPLEPLDLSRSGKNLLLARYDRGEQQWTLWNYSLVDGSSVQLTEPSQNPPYACWSPDGRSIVYASNRSSGRESNLFVRAVAGGTQAAETQITRFDAGGMVPYLWSRDGKWLIGTRGMLTETKSDIFAIPLSRNGGRTPRAVAQTPDYDKNPDLSPDGKWLAYETGTQIFIRRFPGEARDKPFFAAEGEGALWDPSGRKLYFRRGRSMLDIPVKFEPDPQFGIASVLFATDTLGPDLWIRNMLLAPDGKRFLMVKEEKDKAEGRRINIIVNWFSEVKRLFHPQSD